MENAWILALRVRILQWRLFSGEWMPVLKGIYTRTSAPDKRQGRGIPALESRTGQASYLLNLNSMLGHHQVFLMRYA